MSSRSRRMHITHEVSDKLVILIDFYSDNLRQSLAAKINCIVFQRRDVGVQSAWYPKQAEEDCT